MFPDLYKSLLSSMRPLMSLNESEMTLAKSLTKSRDRKQQSQPGDNSAQTSNKAVKQTNECVNGAEGASTSGKSIESSNAYAMEDL